MVKKIDILEKKNVIGQVFTPDYIAEFMVKNILNYDLSRDIEVLEPSVGEGIFLDYLIKNKFNRIKAYEIDENLKKNLDKKYPEVKFLFENFLSSEDDEKFDLIIGNPPYLGQNYNAEVFQEYVRKFPVCKKYFIGNMDLFYFFIHKSILKLKPEGILSFITTNYWITKSKKTGIKFLKPHILNECFIRQYIDLSNVKMFKNAKGQHNCIFVLQKKTEREKSENANRNIDVIMIASKKQPNQANETFNVEVFLDLIQDINSDNIIKYTSALTNNDLSHDGSWNLLYPEQVKKKVDNIESFCLSNGKVTFKRFLRNKERNDPHKRRYLHIKHRQKSEN